MNTTPTQTLLYQVEKSTQQQQFLPHKIIFFVLFPEGEK
jgi:hypothetical protein